MLTFRPAQEEDLPSVIALLADDPIGATREHGAGDGFGAYAAAWKAMQAQGGNSIQLAILDGEIVGVLQLTFIAGLSRGGLVQLTTDKRRHDALRFYEDLGFTATHEGMELELD